jgi:hypothetical protein
LRIFSAAARERSLAEGQIAGGERKCEPTPKPPNKLLARVALLFYVCSCSAVPAEVAEPIVDLLNRCVQSPGSRRETLRQHGDRREMAPQPLEKIESAPGNGMVSKASNLQDVVHGRVADPARLPLTSRDAFRSAGAPRERLRATGVAGKWRRKRLKRLNPRREMVWPRKPLTYKIW